MNTKSHPRRWGSWEPCPGSHQQAFLSTPAGGRRAGLPKESRGPSSPEPRCAAPTPQPPLTLNNQDRARRKEQSATSPEARECQLAPQAYGAFGGQVTGMAATAESSARPVQPLGQGHQHRGTACPPRQPPGTRGQPVTQDPGTGKAAGRPLELREGGGQPLEPHNPGHSHPPASLHDRGLHLPCHLSPTAS